MKKILILMSFIMNGALCMNISAQTAVDNLCKVVEEKSEEVRKTTSVEELNGLRQKAETSFDKLKSKAAKELKKMGKKSSERAEQEKKKMDDALADFDELCKLKEDILSGKETPFDKHFNNIMKLIEREKRMANSDGLTSHDHVMEMNFLQRDLKETEGAYEEWIKKVEKLDHFQWEICTLKVRRAMDDLMKTWGTIPIKKDDPRHPQM